MSVDKSQFAIIGVPCDYQATLHETISIIRSVSPAHSPAAIQLGFGLVELAFEGRLPGYQALQAPYHNRCHTLEVTVCASRLLHGSTWRESGCIRARSTPQYWAPCSMIPAT